jgi:hypothetical protein
LVHALAEELAGFRRRALVAEARLREIESSGGIAVGAPIPSERIAELEQENAELRERLDGAGARTRQMLDRVHFLRQQIEGGAR